MFAAYFDAIINRDYERVFSYSKVLSRLKERRKPAVTELIIYSFMPLQYAVFLGDMALFNHFYSVKSINRLTAYPIEIRQNRNSFLLASGASLLHIACLYNNCYLAFYVLQLHKRNLLHRVADNYGRTFMHLAAAVHTLSALWFFSDYFSTFNFIAARDFNNENCLFFAARNGNWKAIRALKYLCADSNIRKRILQALKQTNYKGYRASYYATQNTALYMQYLQMLASQLQPSDTAPNSACVQDLPVERLKFKV